MKDWVCTRERTRKAMLWEWIRRGLTHTSMAMPCTPDSFNRSKAEANHLELAYLNCPSELTCMHKWKLKSARRVALA